MIDGFFPRGNIRLEETKSVLSKYAAVIPYLSFSPIILRDVKTLSQDSSKWYEFKYDEMFVWTRLSYDNKTDVLEVNRKIQSVTARSVLRVFNHELFYEELREMKHLPFSANLLEAVYNLVTGFKLDDWTRFLKMTLSTQKAYESIAALYYECTLNNHQIGGFDVLNNIKLAFQIQNRFIQKIAIRIAFIYKENSEHSFTESQLGIEFGKLNCYVLADGKEPITLIEQLTEEKNEFILKAIFKELEISCVDGLIHHFISKKHARNVEFLLKFKHTLNVDQIKGIIAQFPAPARKNTTVNTADETETEGFYFIERRLPP